MKFPIYQVDAFSNEVFKGNPAAVVILNHWLEDDVLQNIALENKLSETAFLLPTKDSYEIRWFTPAVEVALCGHATLASAHVLFTHMAYEQEEILFQSRQRGVLKVRKIGDSYQLNFPAEKALEVVAPAGLFEALGMAPSFCFQGLTDYLIPVENQSVLLSIKPDHRFLAGLNVRGVIITAAGDDCDFVSRFFAPGSGIDEDPVTGSAHCLLIDYWYNRLGKTAFKAKQLSARTGELDLILDQDRALISGKAVTYMQGEISI